MMGRGGGRAWILDLSCWQGQQDWQIDPVLGTQEREESSGRVKLPSAETERSKIQQAGVEEPSPIGFTCFISSKAQIPMHKQGDGCREPKQGS